MNKAVLAGLCAAALLGVLVGRFWRAPEPARSSEPSSPPHERRDAVLSDKVAALEAKLGTLEGSLRPPPAAPTAVPPVAPVAAAASAEVESDPSVDPRSDPRQKELKAAFIAKLDGSLRAAPRDARREREVSDEIKQATASPEQAGTSLRELDCSAQLCRAEVAHDSADTQGSWTQVFSQRAPFTGTEGVVSTDAAADGSAHTVVFFAPPGSRLPLPPAAN